MADLDKALATQLANIEKRTGKSLAELSKIVTSSGLSKHGELVANFEEAPKKTYVSYRRTKQFAMIGPATTTRVEVGLNMKGVKPTERLQELPSGQMCNYKIRLADIQDVDGQLVEWIKVAFDAAG